jgi:hypothetical protein
MKKLLLVGALLVTTLSANAEGTFGAGWKPTPFVKLFGQKLSWPIPSLCLGAKAGVTPDAKVSSDGVKLRIPYLEVSLPFPTLVLGGKHTKIEFKLGEVNKSTQD